MHLHKVAKSNQGCSNSIRITMHVTAGYCRLVSWLLMKAINIGGGFGHYSTNIGGGLAVYDDVLVCLAVS